MFVYFIMSEHCALIARSKMCLPITIFHRSIIILLRSWPLVNTPWIALQQQQTKSVIGHI